MVRFILLILMVVELNASATEPCRSLLKSMVNGGSSQDQIVYFSATAGEERPGSISRLGLIGDVHAEDQLLADSLDYLKTQSVGLVLCVGDIVDGGGDVNRSCDLLNKPDIITVRGNHDRWLLEGSNRGVEDATHIEELNENSLSFLNSLPITVEIETVLGQLMLSHGLGEYDTAYVRETDTVGNIYNNLELNDIFKRKSIRIIANGHSHRMGVHSFEHLTVINCGTLLKNANPSCVVLDLNEKHVIFHPVH